MKKKLSSVKIQFLFVITANEAIKYQFMPCACQAHHFPSLDLHFYLIGGVTSKRFMREKYQNVLPLTIIFTTCRVYFILLLRFLEEEEINPTL